MAHMIPPIPKSFDPKSEEGLVFNALRKLPDDYYVFHSVSFSVVDSGTLYEREVDFVVANQKKGILCIEAKNGSGIRYDGRCRRYSSGIPMEHDGPYHQVATAKRGIISKIRCHANPEVQALYDKCKVMHAVFFFKLSEMDFNEMVHQGLPEEADPRITLVAEDLINPTKKIADIFSVKLPREKYVEETKMTEDDFTLLLESVLCPVFNLIPSPVAKNVAMVEQMNQLLREQYKLLDFLEEQDTAVINGAAGTGKTMLAVEKARRHSIDGDRVLFLCYNRMLCDKLVDVHKHSDKKTHRAQFKNVEFKTISQFVREVTGNYKDLEGFMDWLMDCAGDLERFGYKHVVVDEGQDFGLIDQALGINNETAKNNCSIIDLIQEIVLDAGGTFYLFYDKYQMIQGGSGKDYCLPDCIQNSDCRLSLHHNCRNTKEIARTSVTPLRDNKNRAIKPITACSWFEPAKPKMHLIKDEEDAETVLKAILRTYAAEGIKDVVILTPERIDYSWIADKLISSDEYGTTYYYYEYDGIKYMVTTCIRFKGLEADAIIMLDLYNKSFSGKKGLEFYVGSSRAKLRLDMICELITEDYYQVVHELDENAPFKEDPDRMRKILGNTFAADVVIENHA